MVGLQVGIVISSQLARVLPGSWARGLECRPPSLAESWLASDRDIKQPRRIKMCRLSGYLWAAMRMHITSRRFLTEKLRPLTDDDGATEPSTEQRHPRPNGEAKTSRKIQSGFECGFDCQHLWLPTFTLLMKVEDVHYTLQLRSIALKISTPPTVHCLLHGELECPSLLWRYRHRTSYSSTCYALNSVFMYNTLSICINKK